MTAEKSEGAVWKVRTEHDRPAIPPGNVVSLTYRVPPDKREELLAYLGRAFPFYERPGGIRMGLFESIDDPGLFWELVAYATEEDYAADQVRVETAADYAEVLDGWRKLLDGRPEVRRLSPVKVVRKDAALGTASRSVIESVWNRRWGMPLYSPGRQYLPEDVEGLAVTGADGVTLALVTWAVEGAEAEIVTLDALDMGQGHGSRLLTAAEDAVWAQGARRIRLVTTNDNLRSVDFFQRRGYRLTRIHPNGMDDVRRLKPGIPEVGTGRVPLRDLWEMVKEPLVRAR